MQNKGRSKGYTKLNKEKYTGNQQWREGNKDSNQIFWTEGKSKCSTGPESRNINSKKLGET